MELAIPTTTAPAPVAVTARLPFIDNLRWTMIMLVLSMHAAVTYSNHGSWYYNEATHLNRLEDISFLTYQVFLQSFFMGLLFFVAGYFVPGAFDRKGATRFLKDRAYRLGLPSLLYIFVLHPITCYYAAGVWAPDDPNRSFLREYAHYITRGHFLSGNGPLWFCIALLFFCCVYAAWRTLSSPKTSTGPKSFPRNAAITGFILLVAVATFLVRTFWRNGTSWYNMQFGYFSQYIAFFIAGTLAYRHSWLTTLPTSTGRRWGRIGLFGGLAIWAGLITSYIIAPPPSGAFDGGWHWQSLGMSILESLAGVGLSLGCLTLFREKFNRQGPRAGFFSANAFAVYVFHPPILIAITRLMSGWQGEALLKFLVATVLSIVATYALSAGVFRRLPLLKNIL
ncbi:MAG TPA: acyltransferase family protein [Puia sp.]|uniref:acyltransferase family protein n=1 Tax=Puia sp. TaxID=2045100 RepID=UPI002D1BAC16|nr:acyltransferase family protein [Puia sp.]HVU95573.1 acyltransferase family protein [Puia sp.]